MESRLWDDDELLVELQEALREQGPVPERVIEAGRAAFTWLTIDAELERAGLVFDSLEETGAGVRAAGSGTRRTLMFDSGSFAVEMEVDGRSVIGQLVPPAAGTVELMTPGGLVGSAPADELGCFQLELPAHGPVRLRCRAGEAELVTDWVTL